LGVRVPLDLPFLLRGDIMNLFQRVKMEYSKVEWPSKTEVLHSTVWVVTMTVLISIYLGLFDILAVKALNVLEALI
jgi:preprotein translocase, secE subunit